MEKLYIDIDEIKSISTSIVDKSKSILSTFEKECKTSFEDGKECLQVSGLNLDDINAAFNKTFTTLIERVDTLSNFLINDVIPKYDTVTASITKNFNEKLGNEVNELLGITAGTTATSTSNDSSQSNNGSNYQSGGGKSSTNTTNSDSTQKASGLSEANRMGAQSGQVIVENGKVVGGTGNGTIAEFQNQMQNQARSATPTSASTSKTTSSNPNAGKSMAGNSMSAAYAKTSSNPNAGKSMAGNSMSAAYAKTSSSSSSTTYSKPTGVSTQPHAIDNRGYSTTTNFSNVY